MKNTSSIVLSVLAFSLFIQSSMAGQCRGRRNHQNIREKLGPKCKHEDKRFNCLDVVEVTDGDTLSVNIIGVHPYFAKDTSVRLHGLDTPESRPASVKCLEPEAGDSALDREEYEICLEAERLRECEIAASKEATRLLDEAICEDSDRVDIVLATDSNGKLIREKYGRILGKILIVDYKGNKAEVTDAQDLLLSRRLAFQYNGGTKVKRDWCNKSVVKHPKLQTEYIKDNFCSSRKCTEKTYQVRCHRRKTYNQQLSCYVDRIDSNIGRWFSSCKSKSGKERRDCYQSKSENYFEYCRLFDSIASAKSCRKDITETIENFCDSLSGKAAKDCAAVL